MKDMKKAIIILALAVFGGTALFAQNVWTVNYDIGLPLGSMADYISKPSFRGFSINGNTYITDNISVGGTMHWNAYYEKYPRDTYELPEGAVTSTIWAKMYIMPLLANIRYNFMPEGTVRPYVGLGTGAYYIQQETQVGIYDENRNNWRFGLTPEAGLYVPFGLSDFGLHARIGYNQVFYHVDPVGNNLGNLTISIGAAFFSW
jgi:opacity protein-like surface antigen